MTFAFTGTLPGIGVIPSLPLNMPKNPPWAGINNQTDRQTDRQTDSQIHRQVGVKKIIRLCEGNRKVG